MGGVQPTSSPVSATRSVLLQQPRDRSPTNGRPGNSPVSSVVLQQPRDRSPPDGRQLQSPAAERGRATAPCGKYAMPLGMMRKQGAAASGHVVMHGARTAG